MRIIVGLTAATCGLLACTRSLTSDQGGAGASGVIPTAGTAGRGAGGGNSVGEGGVPAGQGAGGAAGVGGNWESGVGGEISIGGFTGTQHDAGAPSALGPDCGGCTRTPIGTPVWEPVGAEIFREPVGGSEDDVPFIARVLAPYHRRDTVVGAFGPGLAHAGPYDGELRTLLVGQRLYPSQVLPYWSIGGTTTSVAILVVLRPTSDAPVGRSPDVNVGPIIPNAVFPLRVVAELQPSMLDPAYDATIPGYDTFVPPIAADGASHAFLRFRASTFFAPAPTGTTGDYTLNVTVTDATGAGWTLSIVFTIAGDPIP